MKKTILIATTAFLTACTPIQHNRGQIIKPEEQVQIIPGQSTRDQVLALLGSPSTASVFEDRLWIYMGQVTENYAFFAPEVREAKVFLIEFNEDDVVADTAQMTEADMKRIRFDSAKTPTAGQELTIIQQIVGNIGRFSGQK